MAAISKEALELKSLRDKIDRYYKNLQHEDLKVKVPVSLKTSAILAIKPTNIVDDNLWQGCVFYLLHSIISRTERKKFKSGNRTKGFVGLKFKYLRDVIGIHTKLTLETLIINGIIKTDGSFAVGGESTGYKLNLVHRKSRTKFVTISNPEIVRRYNVVDHKLFEEQRGRLRKHAYLIKWFLNDTLKIDKIAATEYLDLYSRRLKRNFSKYSLTKSELDEVYTHIDNTVTSSLNVLDNWDKPKPIIDGKGGRLYSPLTSILSQLRYFVKHNDDDLVYFDIRNSQPFHMLVPLNPIFWDKPKKQDDVALHNLNPELEEYIIENYESKYISTIMMLREYKKSGKTVSNKGIERLSVTSPRFASKVVNGKLYKFISEKFAGKFTKKSGFDPFGDDKSAKHEMIRMLYFNPKETHSPSQKPFAEFKKLFPSEAEVIELLKSRSYKDFSVLLQKIESTILLGHVCKEIFNTDSNIPMYTIHDGILTTKENADQVEGIIRSTYKNLMGVEPELSKEVMTPKIAHSKFNDYVTKKTKEIFRDLNKDFKEKNVKLTVEDVQDLTKSSFFKKDQIKQLPDIFIVMPFPWEI